MKYLNDKIGSFLINQIIIFSGQAINIIRIPFKLIQNKIIELAQNSSTTIIENNQQIDNSKSIVSEVGWYSNYTSFNLAVRFFKDIELGNLISQFVPQLPIVGKHTIGGVVGAVLQGYDQCSYQQSINNKFPLTAAAAGFLNGAMCCYTFSMIQSNANQTYGYIINQSTAPKLAWATALITSSFLARHTMCPIEQTILTIREEGFGELKKNWLNSVSSLTNNLLSKDNHSFTEKIQPNREKEEPIINGNLSSKYQYIVNNSSKTSCCCK